MSGSGSKPPKFVRADTVLHQNQFSEGQSTVVGDGNYGAPGSFTPSATALPSVATRIAWKSPPTNPGVSKAKNAGKVYAVFGCKGGAGATTVAVNLAASLAGTPAGAVVVDLDTQLGDVLSALNLEAQSTIVDLLVDDLDLLDSAAVRRKLTPHPTGLFALSQGGRFEQLDDLRADRIPTLVATLTRHFGAVVLDGIRDFGDVALSSLDMADQIIMVLTEDVPSVRGAKRCLDLFRRLGYPDTKVSVVVNRHNPNGSIKPEAISRALNLPITATVVNDFKIVQRAVDEGRLVSSLGAETQVAQDLAWFARRVSGELPPGAVKQAPKKSFLASLFGGGGSKAASAPVKGRTK